MKHDVQKHSYIICTAISMFAVKLSWNNNLLLTLNDLLKSKSFKLSLKYNEKQFENECELKYENFHVWYNIHTFLSLQ